MVLIKYFLFIISILGILVQVHRKNLVQATGHTKLEIQSLGGGRSGITISLIEVEMILGGLMEKTKKPHKIRNDLTEQTEYT